MITMERITMVDPNVIQSIDTDWVDEMLEDVLDDVYEDTLYDDTSGVELDIEFTTDR